MPRHISVREDDTEPLDIVVAVTGVSDLDNLATAVLYLRKVGDNTNHVDGVAVTVKSSSDMTLEFDPVGAKMGGGNALDAVGRYKGYVKLTWSDGDITRHPNFPDMLTVDVLPHYE